MDYLDLFRDPPAELLAESDAVVAPARQAVAAVAVATASSSSQYVSVTGPARPSRQRFKTKPRFNSKGNRLERKNWNLHMQVRRAYKKQVQTENDAVQMLTMLQRQSRLTGDVTIHRRKGGSIFNKKRLVQITCLKVPKGNQHTRRYSMSDFLQCSFGAHFQRGKRLMSRDHQATALGMAPSTVAYMRTVVSGCIMARQSGLLGRLLLLCKSERPLCVALRESFDETVQTVTVNQTKGGYQIIVLKHTLLISWGSRSIKLSVVMPSLLVTSPAADKLPHG